MPHEKSDWNFRTLALSLSGILGMVVFSLVVSLVLWRSINHGPRVSVQEKLPPLPRLQSDPHRDLVQLQARDEKNRPAVDKEINQVAPPTDIKFRPDIGTRLPPDMFLYDEQGKPVGITSLLHEKPALLVPVYFACPMLCNFTLNNLLSALRAMSPTVGQDFGIIVFSINPQETPELARAKRDAYTKAYRRPEGDSGWHFLTGTNDGIDRLTRAIGFHFAKDPAHNAFAHEPGIVVLSPAGKISQFLPGADFEPKQLREALSEARAGKLGRIVESAFLLCYRYDPAHARYTLRILNLLRIAAIGFAVLFFGGIGAMLYVERRRKRASG